MAVAQSEDGGSSAADFQGVEDSWSLAAVHKDQFGVDNLLGPAFVGISADGEVRTRNQYLSDTMSGLPDALLSLEQKVVNVRVVSDVAVVEGTYIEKTAEQGTRRSREERGVFTHVFERQHNRWSCISAQRTAVVNQEDFGPAGKPVKAPQSKVGTSKAALPFHIPLLHKGAQSNDGSATAPAGSSAPPSTTPSSSPQSSPQQ